MGVISVNLQSSFVKIALLHGCSAVGLLHVYRASFWGGLPLNTDNFIYDFQIIFCIFVINSSFEDFKGSVFL